jgi:8-oxo-dGTP pyrophosphatase MutT (NUDIX family)
MKKISHDSETLAKGQQVFTAAAFIYNNFDGVIKVFLPKRSASKKLLPNVFELPGGHVDFGEDMIMGLKREISEEFQKNIKVADSFYVFTYTNEIKGSHSIEVIYFAQFEDSIEDIILHPEDHSEYVWADEETAISLYLEKGEDDAELPAIRKGFDLLNGGSLSFN